MPEMGADMNKLVTTPGQLSKNGLARREIRVGGGVCASSEIAADKQACIILDAMT